MYRMLIVDDEELIVNYLYNLVVYDSGLEIEVAKAYSSIEALQLAMQCRFDIVLTDIQMPGKTGIELQQEIKAIWPQTKFLFLTGHNEFEYARAAIKDDVVDYILKTEGEAAIVGAIAKAYQMVSESIEMERLIADSKENWRKAIPMLQKEYFNELLNGTAVANKRKFKELEFSFDPEEAFLLAIGRIDKWKDTGTPQEQLLNFACRNITEEFMGNQAKVMTYAIDETKYIVVIQPRGEIPIAPPIWDRTLQLVHAAIDRIQSACRQYLKCKLSFAASVEPVGIQRIGEKYNELHTMLTRVFRLTDELIITEEYKRSLNIRKKGYAFEIRMKMKQLPLLGTFLIQGREDEFVELFEQIADLPLRFPDESARLIPQISHSLAAIYLSHRNESRDQENEAKPLEWEPNHYFDANRSWSETVQFYRSWAKAALRAKPEEPQENEKKVVVALKAYIDRHLSDDVSLTTLASEAGFNPAYLSRMFKDLSGQRLSDYITELKISRAKELLVGSSLKINEIGNRVGFELTQHFSRFFKRFTLMTPQEYRDNHNR